MFPGKPAIYVPDMAFMLGPQTPNVEPVVDVILLLRTDKEGVIKQDARKTALKKLDDEGVSYEVWDFPVAGFPSKIAKDNKTVIYDYRTIYPKQILVQNHNHRHAYFEHRMQMGNNVLSRGRMVVTDRLHASIMSALLGIPHIYMDNSYKKITNVRGSLAKEIPICTDENLHAQHAPSIIEAVDLALKRIKGDSGKHK
jgi:pyruvyl transferase EpsO